MAFSFMQACVRAISAVSVVVLVVVFAAHLYSPIALGLPAIAWWAFWWAMLAPLGWFGQHVAHTYPAYLRQISATYMVERTLLAGAWMLGVGFGIGISWVSLAIIAGGWALIYVLDSRIPYAVALVALSYAAYTSASGEALVAQNTIAWYVYGSLAVGALCQAQALILKPKGIK